MLQKLYKQVEGRIRNLSLIGDQKKGKVTKQGKLSTPADILVDI